VGEVREKADAAWWMTAFISHTLDHNQWSVVTAKCRHCRSRRISFETRRASKDRHGGVGEGKEEDRGEPRGGGWLVEMEARAEGAEGGTGPRRGGGRGRRGA
jgi:hypothetical protein